MPFVLKQPRRSRGVVVFTHKERAHVEAGGAALESAMGALRERYLVAMHWGHYHSDVDAIPWVDVHLAGPGTLSFREGVAARRIPLASRNFIPSVFSDRGDPRPWDVLSVARPIRQKNLDQLLAAIRLAHDRGERVRALLFCPCPERMDDPRSWYTGIYEDYTAMFSEAERDDVALLMLRPEGYPFPLGKAFIADLYNQSKSFALFSDQEGESRVVAEALLCGCWVLAKRHVRGGAADYLTAANSYRFTTVEEAAEALIEIRRSTARPARSATIDELSEKASAPRLRAELEKLLGPDRDDDETWNLENLARQLPSQVPTLPPPLRMEFTNDLNGPAAMMTFVECLLSGSPRDIEDLHVASERPARPPTGARMRRWVEALRRTGGSKRPRMIADRGRKLGDFEATDVAYDTSIVKEQAARDHIFALPGERLRFLDVGARDGRLDYLLGIHKNLETDEELYKANKARFDAKFDYFGLDLDPAGEDENVLSGDICAEDFVDAHEHFRGSFDVAYSNNVFEHLRRPWVAARNILALLKPGGSCITIAPFSLRYHESPEDHFRYTHSGLVALFQEHEPVEVLLSGFDVTGRRNNWQGLGTANDIVPVDEFGAWRENWFAIAIVRKPA